MQESNESVAKNPYNPTKKELAAMCVKQAVALEYYSVGAIGSPFGTEAIAKAKEILPEEPVQGQDGDILEGACNILMDYVE